jgi:prolipoprotein diacylglyceryltransferase
MKPILFEFFGWEVPSWHFFFVVAALVAYAIAHSAGRAAVRRGEEAAEVFLASLPQIFIVCYVSGWFGARALSIFVEQFDVTTFAGFVAALFSIGPMTFYGGAFAAVLFGVVFCQVRKVNLPVALDCGMLGGVAALGVGRIGCHFNGDDYGLPVADQAAPPWWSVRFEWLEDGGLYRYPVQLQETIASFLIVLLGFWIFNQTYPIVDQKKSHGSHPAAKRLPGSVAAWTALLSAVNRFFNEAYRGDPRGFFFSTQISTSSGIALLVVIFCTVCLVRLRQRRHGAVHSGSSSWT